MDAKKYRILSVGGLAKGDKVHSIGERIVAVVSSFPTRTSVVLKNPTPRSGQWSGAKVSRRDIVKRAGLWILKPVSMRMPKR